MKRRNPVLDPLGAAGWRRCKRSANTLHAPSNLYCDCMRPKPTVAPEHRPYRRRVDRVRVCVMNKRDVELVIATTEQATAALAALDRKVKTAEARLARLKTDRALVYTRRRAVCDHEHVSPTIGVYSTYPGRGVLRNFHCDVCGIAVEPPPSERPERDL